MKTPFGSTVAAIKLAQMVEDDPKSRRFVSSTISEFNNLLVKACAVNDVKCTRHFYLIIRDSFLSRVEKSTVPPMVKSYLKNVLSYRFRMCRESMELCYGAIKDFKKRKSGV